MSDARSGLGEHLRDIDDRVDELIDWAVVAHEFIRDVDVQTATQANTQAGLLTWASRILRDERAREAKGVC